jgi:uncharacterized GH25 family protein
VFLFLIILNKPYVCKKYHSKNLKPDRMKSNTLKTITFLLLMLVASPQLFAHALWIETKATGTKGKAQEISVYFGEFSENDKWFSDLKDFSLVLVSPSKKETKLTTKALDNKYQAFFTPDEDGVYTIVMHHTVGDVYGTMKLDYNSSATVVVGNKTAGNYAMANKNQIGLFSENADVAKKNQKVSGFAIYDGASAKETKIKVIAPNGWEKELWTNDKGEFSFTPIWSGNYMVEYAHTDKSAGEHNGKKYDEVWKMATYQIVVK